ncbi:Protein IVY1 [Abortiporus biennis]
MPRARSLRSLAISPNRNTSPGPPSPTFSEATNASAMNFGPDGPEKIITRANLKSSLLAYEDLLSKCAAYRSALLGMSKATAGFADAMETCATLKGPSYEAGTRLQAASGLHHLMGNHWHLMAETLDKQFEKPLRQHLENYRTVVTERSAAYEKALREKSNIIRQTEMGNMHKKGRNLQTFREALAILQRQVDELDELKAQHYQEIIEHEEEVWDVVQAKMCLVVRSTLDVFDRFTSKASDPVIEPMLQTVPDPFDSYGPPPAEDKIFSILPPLSVMANVPSSSPSPLTSTTPELESSSDGITSAKSSWTPSVFAESSAAWADVPGSPPPVSTPPRSPPTTSPRSASPPIGAMSRRHSHPGASISPSHSQRKAESKLRSVLSVIDESSPKINGDTAEGSSKVRSSSEFTVTGQSASNSEEKGDITNTDDSTTPRESVFQTQSPADDETPHAERSRSPQSDDTAVPISS